MSDREQKTVTSSRKRLASTRPKVMAERPIAVWLECLVTVCWRLPGRQAIVWVIEGDSLYHGRSTRTCIAPCATPVKTHAYCRGKLFGHLDVLVAVVSSHVIRATTATVMRDVWRAMLDKWKTSKIPGRICNSPGHCGAHESSLFLIRKARPTWVHSYCVRPKNYILCPCPSTWLALSEFLADLMQLLSI